MGTETIELLIETTEKLKEPLALEDEANAKSNAQATSLFDKLDQSDWKISCQCAQTAREYDARVWSRSITVNNGMQILFHYTKCMSACNLLSICVWSFALVLGLHYLNDAQLTLSSTAILVSMIDDGICNCDEYGCGEQYVYQWTVTNSTDCASVTFESYDSCHSRKDMQIEER